ncbi:MAG TPA: biotin-dependent carboxyltransferase family protein [Patescibacteria group bacterium]|nr:biotin-dependent carboxyltransferase family protein [Patescibacteria group bacterium]
MIEVINGGLFTTVQDSGRWGYQAYGMPVAGVMDRYAYQMANLLVDNLDGEAVLEMTLQGGTYRFHTAVWIALCGAEMAATLDGAPVANWSSLVAPAGSELALGFATAGCRGYLALRGGLDVPQVLGSRSTYTRGSVGGIDGKALTLGCRLQAGAPEQNGQRRLLPRILVPAFSEDIELRVLPGPQDDLFTANGLHTLFSSSYTVSADADRMGYRLEGPAVEHAGKPDIISDALCQGAIQIPGHGMPIIMLADRQTTGGYPKIGTVIGSDLRRLAQAKPGDRIRFSRCTDPDAVAALQEEESCYQAALDAFRSKPAGRRWVVRVNGRTMPIQFEERL